MRGLASCARFALVTRLLEELAAQTRAQLPYLASLSALVGLEGTLSLANTLFGLGLASLGLLANLGLGGFGGNGALAGRFAARR